MIVLALLAITIPQGFYEQPVVSQRASYIAGKPVHIYCPTNNTDWTNYVSSSGAMSDANGLTPEIGGDTSYLSPPACSVLRQRLGRKTVNLITLGAVIEIVAHESIHLSGNPDEGDTECKAYHLLPAYLVSSWGFRKGTPAYRQAVMGSREYHTALPAQYRTVC